MKITDKKKFHFSYNILWEYHMFYEKYRKMNYFWVFLIFVIKSLKILRTQSGSPDTGVVVKDVFCLKNLSIRRIGWCLSPLFFNAIKFFRYRGVRVKSETNSLSVVFITFCHSVRRSESGNVFVCWAHRQRTHRGPDIRLLLKGITLYMKIIWIFCWNEWKRQRTDCCWNGSDFYIILREVFSL